MTARDHGAAAMHVQLGHVLAGEARGRREATAPGRDRAARQRADRCRARRRGGAGAAAAQRVAAPCRAAAPRRGSPRPRPGPGRSPARRWCRLGRRSWAPLRYSRDRRREEGPCRSGSKETCWARRRAPICSSTRTTRCIGGPGATRRSPRPRRPASRSCSRSATRPAIGATSWRMRASRTKRPRAVMNDLFVNIKVDREERPDVDAIYMGALHELGEQGGWPLTMFLTSDAEPFWGGTYFPKDARYGRPAFVRVLNEVARIYRDEQDKVRQNADALKDRLKPQRASRRGATPPPEAALADLARRLVQVVDPVHGGIRGAPKFPQPQFFNFLWRAGLRYGLPNPLEAVELTLTHIAQGGIYDHLGGGFARYSVDERWLVPHFEKMLYDNALLVELMTRSLARAEVAALRACASPRRSTGCCARWSVRRRRLRLVARRRQRRRGGEVLCVDARRDRGGARRRRREAFRRDLRRDGRGQFRRPQHSQPARLDRAARRGDRGSGSPRCGRSCSSGARGASGQASTTRCSPTGTG